MSSYARSRFQQQSEALSVPADALYNALLADAELQPPNWDLQGRQANLWKSQGEFIRTTWFAMDVI